jgi:hypothetical protein
MGNNKLMRKLILPVFALLFVGLLIAGCKGTSDKEEKVELKPAPEFDADSAFSYIEKQVDFGPRVPSTDPHTACGDWLVSKLTQFGGTVVEQKAMVTTFDELVIPMRNIIASFQPEKKTRIMLCAHWDTRPFADQDSLRIQEPIDGANDGGSGVGVLLEIARIMQIKQPSIGVDIILFDTEDQGRPEFDPRPNEEHTYCLGSRYWGNNPHEAGYAPAYGILLDMVGAKNATFTMEGVSMMNAGVQTQKVWDTAHQLGYGKHFLYKKTRPITDDHTYINLLTGIPTMDIIQYESTTASNFGSFWHTHLDSLHVIDRNTLKAVGQTVTQVIYNE